MGGGGGGGGGGGLVRLIRYKKSIFTIIFFDDTDNV